MQDRLRPGRQEFGRVLIQPQILIAVADEALRASLEFSLELEGYAVATHGALPELLARPTSGGASCVVIDSDCLATADTVHLDGLAMLALPVILMTSGRDGEIVARRAELPTLRLVDKPIIASTLLEALRDLVPMRPLEDGR